MKKTVKRLFALVLAALFVAVTFSGDAFAAKKKKSYYSWSEAKYYEYRDGQWVISNEDSYSFYKNGSTKSYAYCFYDYDYETKENKKGPEYKYVYSDKKKKSTTKNYIDGKYTGKTVTTWTSKKSTSKTYDEKGKLVSSQVDTLDKHRNTVKSVEKRDNKTYTTKHKNTYKKGRLVKVVSTYSDGTKATVTYSHYSNGDIKKYTYKSKYDSSSYTYDKQGRLTKYSYSNDYNESVSTYEYKGKKSHAVKMTEKIRYRQDNSTETNTYTYKRKYDKKNNLTEEITYKNGEEAYKSVYSGFKKFTYTVDGSKK